MEKEILTTAPAGLEMVNLGLRTKWANMNLGAEKPEDRGLYYQWGNPQGYSLDIGDAENFSPEGYTLPECDEVPLDKGIIELDKLCGNPPRENKILLKKSYDPAAVNWGGSWRVPTYNEWAILRRRCKWYIETVNGVQVFRVVGPNGNSIYLPYTVIDGRSGRKAGAYWSANLNGHGLDFAHILQFDSFSGVWLESRYCCCVLPIRPVSK